VRKTVSFDGWGPGFYKTLSLQTAARRVQNIFLLTAGVRVIKDVHETLYLRTHAQVWEMGISKSKVK
jgi:hypothetical protein